jgi:thiamine biosynthesis lipoprotein
MASFTVYDQAVATSGDYMQAFTPDYAHHHILDPRRGYSPPELASTTLLAPTAAMADGLATAVMVIGKGGLQLIERLPDCEAYVVTKDGAVIKTSGFQEDLG